MAGHVARMEERKGEYWVLVGKPEEMSPVRTRRRRWDDNIKKDVRKVGWGIDWTDVAQDSERWRAVVSAVMNLRFPLNAGNFLTS